MIHRVMIPMTLGILNERVGYDMEQKLHEELEDGERDLTLEEAEPENLAAAEDLNLTLAAELDEELADYHIFLRLCTHIYIFLIFKTRIIVCFLSLYT